MSLQKITSLALSPLKVKQSVMELLQTRRPFEIDLVTVFDAILTSRQMFEKLQCLYENLMSNNFHKTAAVLKKISIVN